MASALFTTDLKSGLLSRRCVRTNSRKKAPALNMLINAHKKSYIVGLVSTYLDFYRKYPACFVHGKLSPHTPTHYENAALYLQQLAEEMLINKTNNACWRTLAAHERQTCHCRHVTDYSTVSYSLVFHYRVKEARNQCWGGKSCWICSFMSRRHELN